MIIWNWISLFGVMSLSANLFASHETCRDLNANSCWNVQNFSSETVNVHCKSVGIGLDFKKSSLNSNEIYSYQFDMGYGDGMGYPEPNQKVMCQVTSPQKGTKVFAMQTIDWGDNVAIEISETSVHVHVRSTWSEHVMDFIERR